MLDANAEARAVKRLFIADNAALANGIGGPNPTLTTQALATRTAEKIFQRYFGGDPWVGKRLAGLLDRRRGHEGRPGARHHVAGRFSLGLVTAPLRSCGRAGRERRARRPPRCSSRL